MKALYNVLKLFKVYNATEDHYYCVFIHKLNKTNVFYSRNVFKLSAAAKSLRTNYTPTSLNQHVFY